MATGATIIHWLVGGVVDSTGAVVASGKARFYQPGTTTPISAYSDANASAAITQPLTLDAGGRGTAWVLVPCRVVVKDSTDTTTLFDKDYTANIRAEQVLITNASINGGTETTLDAAITAGQIAGQYLEGPAATNRSFTDWAQEVELQPGDYGATGNDSADDTTFLQALIDRALDADRTTATSADTRIIHIPAGTWKITGVLTAAVTSGTKQIIIRGDGPKATIIKQYSTSANGLYLNYTGSTSVRTLIENIALTCSTTSSGSGFILTNANKVTYRNCQVGLFRIGFDLDGATDSRVFDCEVVSTDGNASAIGIDVGANSIIRDCIVTGSSGNGDGIQLTGNGCIVSGGTISGWALGIDSNGTRERIRDCEVTCAASKSGIDLGGSESRIRDCYVLGSSSTTGITLGAASCTAEGNLIDGFTTGISVGAVAGCRTEGNDYGTNTANLSVNASATAFYEFGNEGGGPGTSVVNGGSGAVPATITPTVIPGAYETLWYFNVTSGTDALTIGATATTNLQIGARLRLIIGETGAGSATSFVWNAQYVALITGVGALSTAGASAVAAVFLFVWTGTTWALIDQDVVI